MECIIHKSGVTGSITKFSANSFEKIKDSCSAWLQLGEEASPQCQVARKLLDTNLEEVERNGWHRVCYAWITNKTTLGRAVARVERLKVSEEDAGDAQSEPGALEVSSLGRRSLRSDSKEDKLHASGPVLPKLCIICGKRVRKIWRQGKTVHDPLTQCTTIEAAKLKQASLNDLTETGERVRLLIGDADCVAAEVHYHRYEYLAYTKAVYEEARSHSMIPDSNKQAHSRVFEEFCATVIVPKILQNHRTVKLDDLTTKYRRMLYEKEKLNASSYRSSQLKHRLQVRYPQLLFFKPKNPKSCQIVFAETTSALDILEQKPSSSSDSDPVAETDSSGNGSTPSDVGMDSPVETQFREYNSLQVLYNAAMILRNDVKGHSRHEINWPPSPEDFSIEVAEKIVPVHLYNMLAWIMSLSDEPTLDKFVELPRSSHLKLISLIQDVLALEPTRGRIFTPKAYSLGLTVKHWTGSARLIELLNKLGHSISVDTVRSLETAFAQAQIVVDEDFAHGLRKNASTILVYDNIDFSEETLSGHGQSHYTNSLAVQSLSTEQSVVDTQRPKIKRSERSLKGASQPLEIYKRDERVGPDDFMDEHLKFSKPETSKVNHDDLMYQILKTMCDSDKMELPGWTGFNTLLSKDKELVKSVITYLPVIQGPSTEMDTILAILKRSIALADKLELKEISIVCDLAIYAKAQEVRWLNPEFKKRIVIRAGEFHVIMSYVGIIGKRFCDAGLSVLMIESGLVAPGSINGVMNGKHYNRSVRCHKVTYEALCRLRFNIFLDSLEDEVKEKVERFLLQLVDSFPSERYNRLGHSDEFKEIQLRFEEFVNAGCASSKTFKLWSSYIDMVGIMLEMIRATRTSDWHKHLKIIRNAMPWFFAYDHINYARYLPVYWCEMSDLSASHPSIHAAFCRGEWTVQRQSRYGFSAIACDQAIEQTLNRDSKTRGGVVGYTVNENAVKRWILSQSDRAFISRKCESLAGIHEEKKKRKDLERSSIRLNERNVIKVMATLSEVINPFSCENVELVNICSGVIAPKQCCDDMMNALDTGEKLCLDFVQSRLFSSSLSFHDTIKKAGLYTFSSRFKRKTTGKTSISKYSERLIFSRLLLARKNTALDLRSTMSYSLGTVAFSLSSPDGGLAVTTKSNLRKAILEKWTDCFTDHKSRPNACLVIDGMAMIQSMKIGSLPSTFGDFSKMLLRLIIAKGKEHAAGRIDVIFDTYPARSIKEFTHLRRTTGCVQKRKIVNRNQGLPKQWKNFLSSGVNKEELIQFLFRDWSSMSVLENLKLFVGYKNICHVLPSNTPVPELFSDHEEADTRMILHALHADSQGHNVTVISQDTDVFVIAIFHAKKFSLPLHLNIATNVQVNISKLSSAMGDKVCTALPGFHCFTGCDTTSAFYSKGKVKPFEIMCQNVDFLKGMSALGENFAIQAASKALEQFVCAIYSIKREKSVNYARYRLFLTKSFGERKLPPTKDELDLHTRRVNYQTSIHKRADLQYIRMPSPSEHGWLIDGDEITIKWMAQPPAPEELLTATKCACKKTKCSVDQCTCHRNKISCSELCSCDGCLNVDQTNAEIDLLNDESDDDESGDDD